MIIQNRNEIAVIRENNAKMVALNQRDAQTKWGQLEVFMTQWRRIEALTYSEDSIILRASIGRVRIGKADCWDRDACNAFGNRQDAGHRDFSRDQDAVGRGELADKRSPYKRDHRVGILLGSQETVLGKPSDPRPGI